MIPALALLLALAGAAAAAQETYRHPELPVQFEAATGWKRVAHPEDRMIYHMTAPGGGLNVMLWYTTTRREAPAYLTRMAELKGYQAIGEPERTSLRRQRAWVLEGANPAASERVMLGAIPGGEGLYIVQIWCPLERYEEERDRMESVLASVELVE